MTAVILITLFGIALWLVRKWDKIRERDIAKRDAYELDEFEEWLS